MKKLYFLLLLLLTVGMTSCSKTYFTPEIPVEKNQGSKMEVKPSKNEVTNVTSKEVNENEWQITGVFSWLDGSQRIWKLNSGNKVVLIHPVPADMFWKPEYQKGAYLPGYLVEKLRNK